MLRLSDRWASMLVAQPETGMGYQIVSVTLKDGRQFNDVRVVGGVVTMAGDTDEVPFREDEIQRMLCTHGAPALPSNWRIDVEESSAGVYRITGSDDRGHRVVATGTDRGALIEQCRITALRLADSSVAKGSCAPPCSQSFPGVAQLRAFLHDLDCWLSSGSLMQIGSPTLPALRRCLPWDRR